MAYIVTTSHPESVLTLGKLPLNQTLPRVRRLGQEERRGFKHPASLGVRKGGKVQGSDNLFLFF